MNQTLDQRPTRRIRTGLLTAALAGGAVLGVTQIGGIVSAQTDDETETTTGENDPATDDSSGDDDSSDEGVETPDGATGDRAERREERRAEREESAQEIADLLGIDVDTLRERLRDGATLAEIAEENGVATDAVVDLIVGQMTEHLDQAVEDGRIDSDEADEKLAELEERATTRVEEGRPERGDGDRCGPGGGPGGGHGPRVGDHGTAGEDDSSDAGGADTDGADDGASVDTESTSSTSGADVVEV